jgi:hypothetical protein
MQSLRCRFAILVALCTIVTASAYCQLINNQSGGAEIPVSISVSQGPLFITTTQLPAGTVDTPYQATVVARGGVPPYAWSITSGTLPAGLTLNSGSGVISGTPTMAGTSSFTVQVTDSDNERAHAALQIAINGGVNDGALNGHYALSMSGYSNGTPFLMAGAFVADGAGNITSGKIDLNNGSGEYNNPAQCSGNPNCPIALVVQSPGSSYDLSAGNGLGTMTITAVDHLGDPTTFQFSIAIPAASSCVPSTSYSTCGRLIQRDPNNPQSYGSGVLKAQDSTYFESGNFFPGNFALQISGIDPSGARYAAAGALGFNPGTQVDIDCSGNGWGLNGCPLDIDDNGLAASNPIKGSFSADIDTNTGRGDFANMVFSSDPHGYCPFSSACGYAYYIVNKQEMILISSNPLSKPSNLTLWDAVRQSQSGGWNLASFNGVDVIELSGVDASRGTPDVIEGLLTAHGNGSATISTDENDGGTLRQQSSAIAYSTNTAGEESGRFMLSGLSGGSARRVLYLYSPNSGFIVGTDAEVSLGDLQPQTGAPFSDSSVAGIYAGGALLPVLSAVTNSVTSLLADADGHISATEYTSGPGGPGGPTNLTLMYTVDSTGRAVVQNQNGNEFGVLYVIGPSKFVLLPTGSDPVLSEFASGAN